MLIAYNEAGMAEAVGTVYEAVAGLEPLTRFELPDAVRMAPTASGGAAPIARIVWQAALSDRIDALKAEFKEVSAACHDGTLVHIALKESPAGPKATASGKQASAADFTKFLKDATVILDAKDQALAKQQSRPDRLQSVVAASGKYLAVAYWGGTLRIVDTAGKLRAEQRLPQDATALVWLGDQLVVGLADGRVQALAVK